MALCREEKTKEEVLKLFSKGGITPGYINILTWEIQKEQTTANGKIVCHFSALYRCYGDKAAYQNNPDDFFHHGSIGGPVPAALLAQGDDRDVLYSYMQAEAMRHFLWGERDKELQNAETQKEKNEIEKKYALQISEFYSILDIEEI